MRIIVFGYIVRGPLGGVVWHHLQYVMGLKRLGHDVYFFEDSDNYESCYDPVSGEMTSDPSYGLRFASETFARVGMPDCWTYFDAHRNEWLGPQRNGARELLGSADFLVNVSGVNPVRDWALQVPHRALIDTDPVFTQIGHLKNKQKMTNALAHTAYFTFGENFGQENCLIPNDGLPWLATRQPVVLDMWRADTGNPKANFTTVLQWDSYPAVEYDGRSWGMKSASFTDYFELPRRTGAKLEMALGSPSAPRDRLRAEGWIVTDPLAVTRTAFTYQDFIRSSKAEFTVAKQGYHAARSGWFSDRSAAYLASGRPVITQNTGFTDWLKTQDGVLAYDSSASAVECIDRINCDYLRQCRKARAVAEEYFASDLVLNKLLHEATRMPKIQQQNSKELSGAHRV